MSIWQKNDLGNYAKRLTIWLLLWPLNPLLLSSKTISLLAWPLRNFYMVSHLYFYHIF